MRSAEIDHQAIAILHAGDVKNNLLYLQEAVAMARPLGYIAAKNIWVPPSSANIVFENADTAMKIHPLGGESARPLALAAFQRFRQIPDALSTRERQIQERMETTTDLKPLFRTPGAVALLEGRLPAVNEAIKTYDRMVAFDDALRAEHIQV